MIELSFEQRQRIGFQYVLEVLAPCSAFGQELVRQLRPFEPGQEAQLETELDNVARAMDARPLCGPAWARLERLMMQVKDIRRTLEKCGEQVLDEIELFEIKRLLIQQSELVPLFDQISQSAGDFAGIRFEDTLPALELLDPDKSRVASFHVSGRYSQALAQARRDKAQAEEGLRAAEDESETARYTQARREAVAREEREELAVREQLSAQLGPWRDAMLSNCEALGRLDVTLQKAKLALRYNCCRPQVVAGRVAFEDMISPQLADGLAEQGKDFTPVTLELGPGVTVITGANMGGKSVALKAAALNVLAVSCGFFAFARRAQVCLFDSMELLSEDMEDSQRGLSSFGGEIVGLNRVLEAVDRGFALVLLDEFARGTNPHEGAAIAQAVARYLGTKQVVCAMATHYDGVAQVAAAHYQVIGLRGLDLKALGDELRGLRGMDGVGLIARHMNYGLYRVTGQEALPRDAINICRLLGLRPQVLDMAEAGLAEG